MGCITFAGCSPKPSPDTSQTKPDTSKTSKVNLDYFQDADFESTLKENAVVVVMFTADYWGYCKPLKKDLESMAGEFAGKAKFGMVDTQKTKIAGSYQVSGLPTTIILKDGVVSGTVIGPNAPEIKKKLMGVL